MSKMPAYIRNPHEVKEDLIKLQMAVKLHRKIAIKNTHQDILTKVQELIDHTQKEETNGKSDNH